MQLLRTDFTCESSIGLVEDVLAADLDLGLQMFTYEEEEEAGWGDDDFCLGIEGSFVQALNYVGDRFDRAIPLKC